MKTLLPFLFAVLVVLGFAFPSHTSKATAQTPSCTEVQDIINAAPARNRTVKLDQGRTYDNSCAPLTLFYDMNLVSDDAGPRAEGSRLGTIVLLPNIPGQDLALAKGRNYIDGIRFVVKGSKAPGTQVTGQVPCNNCGGFLLGTKAVWDHSSLEGSENGVVIDSDHVTVENSKIAFNYDNVTLTKPSVPQGNAFLLNNDLTQATHASAAVPNNVDVGALHSVHNHYGWAPFGIFADGDRVTSNHDYAITNLLSEGDSFESAGNRWVYLADRYITGTFVQPQAGPLTGPKLSSMDTAYGFESGTARPTGPISNYADGNHPALVIIGAGGDCSNAAFSACPPMQTWKTNP